MKSVLKIAIELILLTAAIYIKYFDEGISAKIEENNILNSLVLFLIYVLILRLAGSAIKILLLGQLKIKGVNQRKDNIVIGI